MSSDVVGASAITRSLTKSIKSNLVMLDLANKVAKLQGRLVLSTYCQKSHSSLVLNTEHNEVVHRRVASTCSCEHARARLLSIEAVRFAESLPDQQLTDHGCWNGTVLIHRGFSFAQ